MLNKLKKTPKQKNSLKKTSTKMKTKFFGAMVACTAVTALGFAANAQETVVVDETVAVAEVPCKTNYTSGRANNWFIQLGAGINAPIVEHASMTKPGKDAGMHFTANYNVGFGKWFSPYVGWRASFIGGAQHWENNTFNHNKWVNGNLDLMWDMFNSLGGVNSSRVFSIVPFIGLGGAYSWDYRPYGNTNIMDDNGKNLRHSTWSLPVSTGIQMRLRMSKYVDFFAEGRMQYAGDNFNNVAFGKPIDMNLTVLGGFSFNLGGAGFNAYNPCDYAGYVANLNNQINEMRGALATTAAALAVAESQLPCPEVTENVAVVEEEAPLMATVRFTINSSKISKEEMVNVFNTAEYLKANPDQKVTIVGYADKQTGTADYNMGLSKRRAEAVRDALVNQYGINPDRLTIDAEGSNVQPYNQNNWNRIVIFNNAQ